MPVHSYRSKPLGRFRRSTTVALTPGQVLQEALACIEPGGSVRLYDPVLGRWTVWASPPLKEIAPLPPDVLAHRLLEVARAIGGTLSAIQLRPRRQRQETRLLAVYLSPYRHERAFLQHATSLIRRSPSGVVHPHLPAQSPWVWARHLPYVQPTERASLAPPQSSNKVG